MTSMRALFGLYVLMIATGIVFYSTVGLLHK